MTPTVTSNGKCNIPFEYNNTLNYFCAKPTNTNKFICETNEPGSGDFDDCNVMSGATMLSKYLKVKQTLGNAYTTSIELKNAIKLDEIGKHRMSFYSYYNLPKNANEHMVISVKNGASGSFEQVYKDGTDSDRLQDIRWSYEDFEIDCTDTEIYVRYCL